MDWDPDTLREAERLLNRGQPSAPHVDALWRRIQPHTVPARKPWWQAGWLWALVPAAAAGMALLMVEQPQFRARGGSDAAALVEASCGTVEQPCHVGQPAFVRVLPRASGSGVATVLLQSQAGRAWLGDAVEIKMDGSTTLPVKVLPDQDDVQQGLSVVVFRTPVALTAEQRTALLNGDTTGVAPEQVLRLEVRP